MSMCRAAGFARVEFLYAGEFHAQVACFRRWESPPADSATPAPEIVAVVNSRDFGLNFAGKRDEYVSCWFRSERSEIRREELRFEAGGFGAPALYLERQAERLWLANFLLPPGLPGGWVDTRLRFADSGFSSVQRVAVGIRAAAGEIYIRFVGDAFDWTKSRVHARDPQFLSFWIKGLPETCDLGNLHCRLDDARLPVDWIGSADADGYRQVNALVPPDLPRGARTLSIEFAGVRSLWAAPVIIE
jgi:hypothetical protein